MFESAFEEFLKEQRRSAVGVRQEMLQKDLTGTVVLMRMLWSVFQSFDGFTLEYEIVSLSGVKIYIDVFYKPLRLGLECDGFVPHAEMIMRERFTFERMRIRTLVMYGIRYIPFSWDELDKKQEACRRMMYELLGRYGGSQHRLSVNEKEILRDMMRESRPLQLRDACECLGLAEEASRRVIRNLIEKNLVRPAGAGAVRFHSYKLEEQAWNLIL
jgi:hypothetical protein